MKITRKKLIKLITEALKGANDDLDKIAITMADPYLRFIRNHPPSVASLEYSPDIGYYISIQSEFRNAYGEYESEDLDPIVIMTPEGTFVDMNIISREVKDALLY